MRILIADGGSAARFALCTLLEQQSGWQVVGEVASTHQLQSQLGASEPDVLLLDWNLPDLDVKQFIPEVNQQFPLLYIIILSRRPETRTEALAAGAHGFVSKGDAPDRLLDAISKAPENHK